MNHTMKFNYYLENNIKNQTVACTKCQREVDDRLEVMGIDENGNAFCMACFHEENSK